jgi:peptidoglycan hydrolase CwlO-like protein
MNDQSDIRNAFRAARPPWSGSASLVIVLVLIAVASAATWAILKSIPAQEHQATAPNEDAQGLRLSGLEASQKQVTDQLKALQGTVSSDQAETKRLSGEVTALEGKLEALQRSFASTQQGQASPAPGQQAEPSRRRGSR